MYTKTIMILSAVALISTQGMSAENWQNLPGESDTSPKWTEVRHPQEMHWFLYDYHMESKKMHAEFLKEEEAFENQQNKKIIKHSLQENEAESKYDEQAFDFMEKYDRTYAKKQKKHTRKSKQQTRSSSKENFTEQFMTMLHLKNYGINLGYDEKQKMLITNKDVWENVSLFNISVDPFEKYLLFHTHFTVQFDDFLDEFSVQHEINDRDRWEYLPLSEAKEMLRILKTHHKFPSMSLNMWQSKL